MSSSQIKNIITVMHDGKRISKPATFSYYMDGNLMYSVDGFEFPIPIEEAKGGCFKRDMMAITLMRWVRKHVEMLNSQGIVFTGGLE